MTAVVVISAISAFTLVLAWCMRLQNELDVLRSQILSYTKSSNELLGSLVRDAAARTMKEKGIVGTPEDLWRHAGLMEQSKNKE